MEDYEIQEETQKIRKPKILSFDLEIFPSVGMFYPPTWETGIIKTIDRSRLASFAYQWVNLSGSQPKAKARALSDTDTFKVDPLNDALLIRELHKVMSEADILLGHNSDRFDVKYANYFFIQTGLGPLPPQKFIDTVKIAKKYFYYPNNKLDTISKENGHKGKTDKQVSDLWQKCYFESSVKAYRELKKYNIRDVEETTAVYMDMRPWMRNHPNIARISGEWDSCPRCGSYDYRVKAYRTTNTSRYHQYFCNGCKGYFTDRKAITEKQGDMKPLFSNS